VGDKVVCISSAGSYFNLLLRGRCGFAVRDVLRHSPLKQDGFLPDQPELRPQPPHIQRLDVNTIKHDKTTERVVEALKQLYQCRLATTRAAAQRHRLAGGDTER